MYKTENLNARVSAWDKKRLSQIANGNISKGVREALQLYFAAKEKAEAPTASTTSG